MKSFHSCLTCNISFPSETCLINHEIKWYDPKPTYKVCSDCGFKTDNEEMFLKHMQIHRELKPTQCTFCDLQCSTQLALKDHMKIHNIKHRCTDCGLKFISDYYLKLHILRQHMIEKPYKCSECDKSFITKYALNAHTKTHTGERNYECTLCDSKFVHRSTLTGHKKVHRGNTPFHCTVCDSKFNSNLALIYHQRVHYGQELHKCTMCSSKFSKIHLLQGHMKNHRENETGQ